MADGWLAGKKGLVVGIANERSFAWFIAQSILVKAVNASSPICLATRWLVESARPSSHWASRTPG